MTAEQDTCVQEHALKKIVIVDDHPLLRKGLATVIEYHGSAHLVAYVSANGILRIDSDCDHLSKGDCVSVRQI